VNKVNFDSSEDGDNGAEELMTKGQKFRKWMSNWCDLFFNQPRY
jgi:hypothetical protein